MLDAGSPCGSADRSDGGRAGRARVPFLPSTVPRTVRKDSQSKLGWPIHSRSFANEWAAHTAIVRWNQGPQLNRTNPDKAV
jgi:hypothetical protein